MYLSEKARDYTMDKLTVLGFNGDFGPRMALNTSKGVELYSKNELYNGQQTLKWDVSTNSEGGGEPFDDAMVRKLNAYWEQKKKQASSKPAPSVKPAPPEPDMKAAAEEIF